MNDTGEKSWSKLISGLIIGVVMFTSPANAQEHDYFSTPRDNTTLRDVERYHLGRDNFWKKYRAGEFRHAVDDLKFVLRYFPNHPQALVLIGGIGKLMGATELAIPFYERAIQLYPEHAMTHAQYGRYLTSIRTEAAINKLKDALHIDPTLNAGYVWLAGAYLKSGRPELASQILEDARTSGAKTDIPMESSGK